jgi:hypothetical protein
MRLQRSEVWIGRIGWPVYRFTQCARWNANHGSSVVVANYYGDICTVYQSNSWPLAPSQLGLYRPFH